MMRKGLVQSIAIGLGLFACGEAEKETTIDSYSISEDQEALKERLIQTNENVELVDPESGASLVGLLPDIETFTVVQVAELLPPTVSLTTLQATDVVIDGFSTYIAYNVAGDTYAGAIDVLDVTQVLALKILTGLTTTTSEYNGIARDGTTLYAVGATKSDTPAILTKFNLTAAGLFSGTSTNYSLPSYAGTDVLVTSSQVLATSGDAGGLTLFTKATMAQAAYTALADARSVDVMSDGSIMALRATGKANVYTSAGSLTRNMTLGGATIAQSKSTLQVGPKWSLAALGDGGMTVFCNANGTIIANVPQVTLAGIAAAKTVTNAASSSNGLVFSANGEAGIYVYSLKDVSTTGTCGTGKLTLLGNLKFSTGFSANAVFYKNGFLFVVTGTGGLRILTPVYVSTVPLSSNL